MSDILTTLQNIASNRGDDVMSWFEAEFLRTPALFYSSTDLRHSGQKLAPVDTNLFPAGFNNLSMSNHQHASKVIGEMVARRFPTAKKLLLLPENHTRNQGYIDNLQQLIKLIEVAGLEVRLGRIFPESMPADEHKSVTLTASDGAEIYSSAIIRDGDFIHTEDGFTPDIILVNNDLTSGAPTILCGIEQKIAPPVGVGWYRRRKSIYFNAYDKVAESFAGEFDVDPWLISTFSHKCGTINFKERKGIECVAIGVEKVIHRLRSKYQEYGLKGDPYVFIKADSGTYGMGIMTARSGDEVYDMNKKNRKKMNIVKENTANNEVIIQEGVPTIDLKDNAIAEPVIYMLDAHPVGGFWRVNKDRDIYRNLNASGMHFESMTEEFSSILAPRNANTPLAAFAIIAKLATLAASREEYQTPTPCDE